MNSTPSSPAATMRFTALLPPPPTPTTLMRAPDRPCSSSLSRNASVPVEVTCVPFAMCPPRCLEEFLEKGPQPAGHAAESSGAHGACRLAGAVSMCIHDEPDGRRECGTVHVIRKPTDTGRRAAADGQVKNLFGDFGHPF